MAATSRVLLQIGEYDKSAHYAVIGKPTQFYLWYKPRGQKGYSSRMLEGSTAHKHYTRMHELLNINHNEAAFVSYLTDLYMLNPDLKKTA